MDIVALGMAMVNKTELPHEDNSWLKIQSSFKVNYI